MNKSCMVRLAILVLTISTLSGCILVPVDDGYRGENLPDRDRDRGGRHGDNHQHR